MNTGQAMSSPARLRSLLAVVSGARALALMIALAALLPWVYALANELFLIGLHGGEGGDLAVLEVGILDAWEGERLLGPYSRFGWHHPGPIYFYLLLPLYAVSKASSAALYITSALIGCFALSGLLWTAWTSFRRAGRSFALLLPIALLALVPVLFGIGLRPWNPVVVVLPFGLLLLLAARLAAGNISVLPWVIALHAFVSQTHVGTALVSSLILIVACLLLVLDQNRPSWKSSRLPLAIAAAALLLCWLPVVFDQLSGEKNLGLLAQFAQKTQGTLGPARGLQFAARQLAAFFTTPLGLRDSAWGKPIELATGIALCLLLPFSARRARTLGEPVIERLIVLSGVALIGVAVSATRIVGEVHDYLAYFMFAVGAVSWGAALSVWVREAAPPLALSVLAGAVVTVPLVRTMPLAHTSPSALKPTAEAHAALMQSLLDDILTVKSWKCEPVLTTGWYAGDDDWGLLAKVLVELRRRKESVTLQSRHRFMFGGGFSYRRSGDCELIFSRVDDRSLPVLSRHGAVFTQVSPPDQKSRASPDMRDVSVVAARGIDGNPARLTQSEQDSAEPALRLKGPDAAVELELPGATLRSAWLVAEAPSDYVIESSVDRANWQPLGQFSSAGDLLREPAATEAAAAWVRLRAPRTPTGTLSSLNFEFGAWSFVLESAPGVDRAGRIVDGLIPSFDATLGDEQLVELAPGARIRLLAPTAGLLRGLSLVAELRGAYRLSVSTDGRIFREVGEIAAGSLAGLGRHDFFFEEALSVLELAASGEGGPHAIAEVTPIVWDGVDFGVGTPRGRRYLLDGWSGDTADRRSAYAWLLDRAGLKLPDRPGVDHTLEFWLAVLDEPGQKPVFTVTAGGTRLFARTLSAGEQTVRVVIPARLVKPWPRVELGLEYAFSGGGAAEGEREPSVAVRRIVLSKAEPYVRAPRAATVF
jgi:hypothetical protein